jgi:hypothetical protein
MYLWRMTVKLAAFFSWIFQPLLMQLYGALLLLNLPFYAFNLLSVQLKYYVLISTALFTVVLPMLSIILLKQFRFIDSLQLYKREDRKYPILFTLVFQATNYYYLTKAHLPALYYLFLIAALFSLLVTLLITYYWKISMHMTGIGGVCGVMLLCALAWQIDLRLILASLFVIAGIIGTSRLILHAHTPSQVAAGFLAGLIPQLSLLLLVQRL